MAAGKGASDKEEMEVESSSATAAAKPGATSTTTSSFTRPSEKTCNFSMRITKFQLSRIEFREGLKTKWEAFAEKRPQHYASSDKMKESIEDLVKMVVFRVNDDSKQIDQTYTRAIAKYKEKGFFSTAAVKEAGVDPPRKIQRRSLETDAFKQEYVYQKGHGGKKGGADDAKQGGADGARQGEADDAKQSGADGAKQGEADGAKQGEGENAKQDEADDAKQGEGNDSESDEVDEEEKPYVVNPDLGYVDAITKAYHKKQQIVYKFLGMDDASIKIINELKLTGFCNWLDAKTLELLDGSNNLPADTQETVLEIIMLRFIGDCLFGNNLCKEKGDGYSAWETHVRVLMSFAAMWLCLEKKRLEDREQSVHY